MLDTAGVKKGYTNGTHRLISPQETVEGVRPFMRRMGITRIANVTGLDCIGIPVVMVVRPNARSVAVSQGKGLDLWAAKASGLMESVEGYHAEYMNPPLKYASYAELRQSHPVIEVTRLLREEQSLFHAHRPLLWVEAFDLIQDEPMWVPYELVHTNYTVDATLCPKNFAASSNGLASGNHILEAISHAICEAVERDSTPLWTLLSEKQQDTRLLDLATVDDPGCREVLDRFAQADVLIGVWDSTSDVGLASFECSIVDRSGTRLHDLYSAGGSGCHPAREVALLRALTEAAQSRAAFISGSRDDMFRGNYERAISPEAVQRQRQRLERASPCRAFQAVPTWDGDTLESDVAWELKRLAEAGIQRVLVLDLTRPEYGLPVARVIVPGLEARGAVPNAAYGPRARAWLTGRA